ncbi:MAG: cohesin domain-containing protein [Candidatus Gottesmanbacteria bacterium]
MKKVLILLMVVFIIGLWLISGLFILSSKSNKPVSTYLPPLTTSPIPPASPVVADAILSINPLVIKTTKDQTVKVDIMLESTGTALACDLDINYDPNVLTLEKITPGTFFNQPMEFSKSINEAQGKIFYALGSVLPSSGPKKDIVVSLEFKGKSTSQAQLRLGDKTLVSMKDVDKVNIILPK